MAGEDLVVSGQQVACPAVYHSCAPVSISGDPDKELSCDTRATDEALEWPFMDAKQAGVYLYEGDEGNWTGNWPRFATEEGGEVPLYAKRAGPCAQYAPDAQF